MDIDTFMPLVAAAKHTSSSESCIRRGLNSGDIKGFKVARDWVLPRDEVNRHASEYPLGLEGAGRDMSYLAGGGLSDGIQPELHLREDRGGGSENLGDDP